MTLHATRDGRGSITVHATYGTAKFEITEEAGHLRYFCDQLAALIDEVTGQAPEQAEKRPPIPNRPRT